MRILTQLAYLLIIAMPIATMTWAITHEEIAREFREGCATRSVQCRTIMQRKFFYLFTCEYCFSHYVTAVLLIITRFKLLYPDWRGYVLSEFSLVWIANIYMSLFAKIRLDVKLERKEIEIREPRGK